MGSSINIALPSIGDEFSLSAVTLSWVATSYLLAAAMFLVPFGRIADIHGRKLVFLLGMCVFTLASLLSGFATSATQLIVFRVIHGIGSAMIFGTAVAILMSVFPPGERGRVLGISVAAVYLGLSLGPFLGGILTEHLTWRSVFFVNVPLGLIVIAFVLWKLRGEWAEARGERFDFVGSAIWGVALALLMYGFSKLPGLPGAGLTLIGVAGIVVFAIWELRAESPVLDMRLFRDNRVFAFSNLAALINYSATFAVTFLLSLYLQKVKGLSPQYAGTILVAQPVVMAFFSPFAGRLSDRIEPRLVASLGMALTTLGLFFLIFVNDETTLPTIVASLCILGLGFALFSSPNTNAVMSSVSRKFYGVAAGTVGTMRLTGQMLSMGVATMVFAIYIGGLEIEPEIFPLFLISMRTALIIFAAACFAGIFASLARGKVR